MNDTDFSFYYEASYKPITERRLNVDTCKKFGVRTNAKGHHLFPCYNEAGELKRVKTVIPKTEEHPKKIFNTGSNDGLVLFGANAFPKTGRTVTITEGEYDAMSAYELSGSKYPCFSINDGTGSARPEFEANYEALNMYDSIIINFDADKPGKDATEQVAPMFPGKSKVLQLVEDKDASDYKVKGRAQKYVDEFFRAKTYTLGGIVNGKDTWEAYKAKKDIKSIPWPTQWRELNAKTYGVRLGEIVLVTAGTGSGKTQFLRELKYFWLTQTKERIMDISLEEDMGDSAGGLMALHANKRITLPDVNIPEAEEKRIHKELFDSGRILFLDHAGSFEDDSLIDKITYAATVEKCSLIFLDHITIAVSDGAAGQENMTMDKFMNRLLKIVKRLPVCIIVVSHLRKTGGGGTTFEGGRIPCEDDLKGSGSLKQISFTTIALARNKYAEDEKIRNTTSYHSLKCRFTGRTGPCDYTYFDDTTGRMTQIDPDTFFDETGYDGLPMGSTGNKGKTNEF